MGFNETLRNIGKAVIWNSDIQVSNHTPDELPCNRWVGFNCTPNCPMTPEVRTRLRKDLSKLSGRSQNPGEQPTNSFDITGNLTRTTFERCGKKPAHFQRFAVYLDGILTGYR